MTFDDDFVQIDFGDGVIRRARCLSNKIEWPPPQILDFGGFKFDRVSVSEITDEQRAGMSHVCRGAAYAIRPASGESAE
jgi:hypothetical protein